MFCSALYHKLPRMYKHSLRIFQQNTNYTFLFCNFNIKPITQSVAKEIQVNVAANGLVSSSFYVISVFGLSASSNPMTEKREIKKGETWVAPQPAS